MSIEKIQSYNNLVNNPPVETSHSIKPPDQIVISYSFQHGNSSNQTQNILLGLSNDHLPKVKKPNKSLISPQQPKNKLFSLIPQPKKVFRQDNRSIEKTYENKPMQNMPKRYKELVHQKQNNPDQKINHNIIKNLPISSQNGQKNQLIIPKIIQNKYEPMKKQSKFSSPKHITSQHNNNKQKQQKVIKSDLKNAQKQKQIPPLAQSKSPYHLTNMVRKSINKPRNSLVKQINQKQVLNNNQSQHQSNINRIKNYNDIKNINMNRFNNDSKTQHLNSNCSNSNVKQATSVAGGMKSTEKSVIKTGNSNQKPQRFLDKKDNIFQQSKSSFKSIQKSNKSKSHYNNLPSRSISRSPNSPHSPIKKFQRQISTQQIKTPMQRLQQNRLKQLAKTQNDKPFNKINTSKSKRSQSINSSKPINKLKNSLSEAKKIESSIINNKQKVKFAYNNNISKRSSITNKNYNSPNKSQRNNNSIDKMSQTLRSKRQIGSTRSLLSNRSTKQVVSAHSNSKRFQLVKPKDLKNTSLYNKNPLNPKNNTNMLNNIINKSKSSSILSINSNKSKNVSTNKSNLPIKNVQSNNHKIINQKYPKQLQINHEVQEQSCFSQKKTKMDRQSSNSASAANIKSKKEIQDEQLDEIQKRIRTQQPSIFKKGNFQKSTQKEVLPFQNGVQPIFTKQPKISINSNKNSNKTTDKVKIQSKLNKINKNTLRTQKSSQNFKPNIIRQKQIAKPKIITNKLQQTHTNQPIIQNDNIIHKQVNNHQNIESDNNEVINANIEPYNIVNGDLNSPLRPTSKKESINKRKNEAAVDHIQDLTGNNEIKGFKVTKNVVSIKPPTQIKRNSQINLQNTNINSNINSLTNNVNPLNNKKPQTNSLNNPKRESIDGAINLNNKDNVASILNKNQNTASKTSGFKPTIPKTPQEKAHNFKNWKDSELNQNKNEPKGIKNVPVNVKKDIKGKEKVINNSRGKNREKKVEDIDLDAKQEDKFGVLSANRHLGKRVSKNIKKQSKSSKLQSKLKTNNEQISEEEDHNDISKSQQKDKDQSILDSDDDRQIQKLSSIRSKSEQNMEVQNKNGLQTSKITKKQPNNQQNIVQKYPNESINLNNQPNHLKAQKDPNLETTATKNERIQQKKQLNIHQIHMMKQKQQQNIQNINNNSYNKKQDLQNLLIATQEIQFNKPKAKQTDRIDNIFQQQFNQQNDRQIDEKNINKSNNKQKQSINQPLNHQQVMQDNKNVQDSPQNFFYSIPINNNNSNHKQKQRKDTRISQIRPQQSFNKPSSPNVEDFIRKYQNTSNFLQPNNKSDDFFNSNLKQLSRNQQSINNITNYQNINRDISTYQRAPILSFIYQPLPSFIQMKNSFKSSNDKINIKKQIKIEQQERIIEDAIDILKDIDQWILQRIFQPYLSVDGQIGLWLYCNGSWNLFFTKYSQSDNYKTLLIKMITKSIQSYNVSHDLQNILTLISGLRIIKLKVSNKKLFNEFEYSLKKKHVIKGIAIKENGIEKIFEIINIQLSKQKQNIIQVKDENGSKYWIKQQKFKSIFHYFLLICNRQATFWTTKPMIKKDKHRGVITLSSNIPAHGSVTLYYPSQQMSSLYLYKELSSKVLKFMGKIEQKSNKNGNLYFQFRLQGKYYLFVECPQDCNLAIQSTRQLQTGQIEYIKSETLKNQECQYVELNALQRQKRMKELGMNNQDLYKLKEQFIRMISK